MNFSFSFLLTALRAGAAQIPVTLAAALIPLLIALVPGLLIALARFFRVRVLGRLCRWLVTVVKGIPVLLILMVFYLFCALNFDPLMRALGLPFTFRQTDKLWIAAASLSIYAAVGLSEAFRGALESVARGQFDAAYAMGLSPAQTLMRIVLPQALPVSLPIICNILVMLVKAAAIASLVGVIDVMNGAVIAAAGSYRFLEAYAAAALIYWALCFTIERAFRWMESRFARQKETP
ncbi:MAG: amino acid ABC transporter permease [Treponema sp.]|jgi:L-cystine transport system permease protein|nr:amino acid ABC transporter permease [Treponema sp.]